MFNRVLIPRVPRPDMAEPFPVLAVAFAAVVLVSRPATAQQLLDQYIPPNGVGGGTAFQPGVTVNSRARPDYDSSGVTLGDFTIRPALDESSGYETNVLGTPKAQGSAFLETHASTSVAGDASPARVNASVSVDDERYFALPSQSHTNWIAALGGAYDVGRDVATAYYSHSALTQTPGGLDTPRLQRPLPYTVDDAQLSYRINFNKFFVTPAVDAALYSFGDSLVQGTTYTQNYQNRIVVTPSFTFGYEVSPRRDLVLVVRDADASFTRKVAGIASRDYNDAAVLTGLDYDADAVVRFRVLVGYEVRAYRNAQYSNISAPVVEASAIWTPTGLTTLTGTAGRRIQDSADVTTAGYTDNYVRVRVDHEYLPNVLLRANAGADFTSYARGGGSQNFYNVGAGASYLLNRNMALTFSYDLSVLNSSGVANFGASGSSFASGYTDHRLALQLRLRL